MLDRTNPPDFIEITPEDDLAKLKAKFEADTEKVLYDGQLENIMINLMVYYMNQQKLKFNSAARKNLPQFSTFPFLNFIGEMFNCEPLPARKGTCTLQIVLKEAFNQDLTILKGLEVQTKDEKYTFITQEDLIIPAGQVSGTVLIESEQATAEVNNYGAGDITILLRPYTYIDGVTNTTAVTGGADEETEESYIQRILEAPEGFSCAGSKGAYKYFTKSAHPDITDCAAICEQKPATVEYDNETYTESGGNISSEKVNAQVDYYRGKMTLAVTVGEDTVNLVVTIPPAAKVSIYPLTKNGTLSDAIKTAVEEKLSDETIRPMTDVIEVIQPPALLLQRTVTIIMENDAISDAVTESVQKIINEYTAALKQSLNKDFITSQFIRKFNNNYRKEFKVMMNYEMFKGIVESELSNFLGEEYKDMKVVVQPTYKVNEIKDAVTLLDTNTNVTKSISPTLYLEEMYTLYKSWENLPKVMKVIADRIDKGMVIAPELLMKVDFDNAKDKIIWQIINADQNKELLADCPHRKINDLAVI